MGKKALVVEDDINIAELLRLYLEKDGFEVFHAEDGGEGIRMAQEVTPDLVLLDIMLPVVDGWVVCSEIRKTSQVPIIMLTAKSETLDKISGLEMGADESQVDFVAAGVGVNVHASPPDLSDMATCLDAACGRRVLRAPVVCAFMARFEARYDAFARGEDWMTAYRARSVTLGRRVRVMSVDETFEGTAQDVDASGALVVQTQDGPRTVLAGDVSVRGVMGYV